MSAGTVITTVEITGVEGWTFRKAAEAHVIERNPGARVISVTRTAERGEHGHAVWAVEWEPGEQ